MQSRAFFLSKIIFACILLPIGMSACGRKKQPTIPEPMDISTSPIGEAPILSSKDSVVYHLRTCLYTRNISKKDLRGFQTWGEAVNSGRIPCAHCKPTKIKTTNTEQPNESTQPSVHNNKQPTFDQQNR